MQENFGLIFSFPTPDLVVEPFFLHFNQATQRGPEIHG